jgi:hypothetical protein
VPVHKLPLRTISFAECIIGSRRVRRALQFFGSLLAVSYSSLATQMSRSQARAGSGLFLFSYAFHSRRETQQHIAQSSRLEEHGRPRNGSSVVGDAVLWSGYRDQWIMEVGQLRSSAFPV